MNLNVFHNNCWMKTLLFVLSFSKYLYSSSGSFWTKKEKSKEKKSLWEVAKLLSSTWTVILGVGDISRGAIHQKEWSLAIKR